MLFASGAEPDIFGFTLKLFAPFAQRPKTFHCDLSVMAAFANALEFISRA
jgi:hypothetical protein|tara:strand:+ start:943 stop:1092 length:150 start_codon:yes stop_codon:yes gene_type:complete